MTSKAARRSAIEPSLESLRHPARLLLVTGGLPEETARGIAEQIVFTLAMAVDSILLASIISALLLLFARRLPEPWRRAAGIGGRVDSTPRPG